MKSRFLVLSVALLATFFPLTGADAAGTGPKLTVNCGQITGQMGDLGTYGLFAPRMSVKYYGSPLVVTAYLMPTPSTKKSEASQQIVTFTDKASSSKFFNSRVDLQARILEWGQKQTGYFKILIEAVDTLKRKGTFTCLYKDYFFSTPTSNPATAAPNLGLNKGNCSFSGKQLFGKVQIVEYGADFEIQKVDYGSDLKVRLVEYGASSCGKWQIVDYGANFKVQLVDYGADFKVQFVDYGEGFR